MGNSETNSTKASVLEKITEKTIKGVESTVSNFRKFNYNMGYREWTSKEILLNTVNSGIKLFASGITLGGSICYAIGKGVYKFEKKMGESDSDRDQKYELSVKKHYSKKYRTRKNNWTFH